jgi:hypothetical protein
MTKAQEKAYDIVKRFSINNNNYEGLQFNKRCAIILIEEILKEALSEDSINFWCQVRQEVHNIELHGPLSREYWRDIVQFINKQEVGALITRQQLVMIAKLNNYPCEKIVDTYRTYLTQCNYIDFYTRGVYIIKRKPVLKLTIEDTWKETTEQGGRPFIYKGEE